jgi:hypothetical protein
MQLIEVSVTGVRSAVITLRASDRPHRILLFPMLHLGSPGFYAEVTARLGSCAVVLAEGIRERSLITRALTVSYRLPGRRGRLGLVVQRIDYAGLDAEVITPDMTGRQLRAGFRAVPALQRAALLVLAPVVGGAFWLLGTRRMLARYAAAEDLPDAAEILMRDRAGKLTELLLDRRDALLAAALDEVLARRADEPVDIAVVYGAAHMPALTRYLLAAYGFRPREAEWLTVFDF